MTFRHWRTLGKLSVKQECCEGEREPSRAWWYKLATQTLGKLLQEDAQFWDSLGYVARVDWKSRS